MKWNTENKKNLTGHAIGPFKFLRKSVNLIYFFNRIER